MMILFVSYNSSYNFKSLTGKSTICESSHILENGDSDFARVPTNKVTLQIFKHYFFLENTGFYKTNLLRQLTLIRNRTILDS
ncbi:hypothetical protein B2G50_02100 [Leptospira interrogans serovar Canicola]|nr:hypothetical protein B2G50_02100 [Leptospira interrogans serovar Canicola]